MYADDSSTFVALTDMIKKAREIIGRHEKTTAGKLHDGKTIMMKLGITRLRDMTSKQLGVDFRVMTEEERELPGRCDWTWGDRRREIWKDIGEH